MTKLLFHKLKIHRQNEDTITISYEPHNKHLTTTNEGLQIIQHLHKNTTTQTQKKYPDYDIQTFAELLIKKGLVYRKDHQVKTKSAHIATITKHQFKWTQTPIITGLLLGLGIASILIMLAFPQLIPTPGWFFYTKQYSLLLPLAFITYWIILFIHEIGHNIALKRTGINTTVNIVHKWYLLLPETNTKNVELLPIHQRIPTYIGGILADAIILTTSLILITIGIIPEYFQLVALLAFINILFQFTPFKGTDLTRIAEHILKTKNLTTTVKKVLKQGCFFCKKPTLTPQEEITGTKALPIYILAFINTALITIIYDIPILLQTIIDTTKGYITGIANNNQALFIDSTLALIIITTTLSFYFISLVREHHHNNKEWFTWIMTTLFILTNFATAIIIAGASITTNNPVLTTILLVMLGFIFGTLFIKIINHIEAPTNSFTKQYLLPSIAAATALILVIILGLLGGRTEAIYGVAYSIGMLGSLIT